LTGAIAASSEVVYDDGTLRISRMQPPPLGLVLAGEADEAGYQPLVAALAGLPAVNGDDRIEVHVDLSGLRYCDAAALHAMIAAAEDGSRRVVLHHPAAPLRALIRIAGWQELPGLTVVTAR
jgi:ABC-type transporter Mla MlaB component